ncbi:hypothetical protein 2AV2_126 [Nodularia phage vB_NpeS-2AV2]|uniref:Uncharacterized protein n=2 Tax=Ravarandavirus TaxID=2843444 RepID=A0A482MK97_9CAUD|nr:hypothetical protein HWA92_gp126 [Nodularia phage vB_NpeS-2AV2]ALY07578.1 hypothetical protein 2AV2_126 [Nodularia phage vB_NpeS-2AV2]QBQ73985.1 hypothetical protein kac68v162_gp137 [Nodularia phage vB_NspS-kac68v162]
MPKKVFLTYNGLTLTKSRWIEHLGISRAAFYRRFNKYYPDQPEKVFSEVYLTPGANMPNETIKEARVRSRESSKRQYEYTKLLGQKQVIRKLAENNNKLLEQQLAVVNDTTHKVL